MASTQRVDAALGASNLTRYTDAPCEPRPVALDRWTTSQAPADLSGTLNTALISDGWQNLTSKCSTTTGNCQLHGRLAGAGTSCIPSQHIDRVMSVSANSPPPRDHARKSFRCACLTVPTALRPSLHRWSPPGRWRSHAFGAQTMSWMTPSAAKTEIARWLVPCMRTKWLSTQRNNNCYMPSLPCASRLAMRPLVTPAHTPTTP